jgi:quinol monooxygenase YgiN
MILVLGSFTAQPGRIAEALALSQAHVRRSRTEPGCLAHAVHVDSENADRLVFVEQWSDGAALKAHFKVPESRAFVASIAALSTQAPAMAIYEATPIG